MSGNDHPSLSSFGVYLTSSFFKIVGTHDSSEEAMFFLPSVLMIQTCFSSPLGRILETKKYIHIMNTHTIDFLGKVI
jgi:hypothetical protein